MTVAIFDLDNTLLDGDSDYLWGKFLVSKGVVDAESYERANDRFYKDYKKGVLDIFEFMRFALKPLAANDMQTLQTWRQEFLDECIRPRILPKAQQLVEQHRQQNHTLLIITATNRFVTEPIAKTFGVDDLLATEAEMVKGRFTGEVRGTPCFREGKIENLRRWLATKQETLNHSWCYSDSHNDIPLLSIVTHPVAVDADNELRRFAEHQGWTRMSLR